MMRFYFIVSALFLFSQPSVALTGRGFIKRSPIMERKIEIVKSLMEAMKKNDSDMIKQSFTVGASQAYGNGSPKTNDEFRNWLKSDIIDAKGKVLGAKYSIENQKVIVKGTYENSLGYKNAANFLFTVEDGKIASWVMRY